MHLWFRKACNEGTPCGNRLSVSAQVRGSSSTPLALESATTVRSKQNALIGLNLSIILLAWTLPY